MSSFKTQNPYLAWPIFAIFIAVGFGWMGAGQEYATAGRLRREGIKTSGKIMSIGPSDSLNYASANYEFQIGGKTIYGYSHVSDSTAAKLGPGSPIDLFYLPQDVSKSGFDLDAIEASGKHGILIAVILELIVAAIFLPLVLSRKKAKREAAGGMAKKSPSITLGRGESISAMVVIGVMALGGLFGLSGAASALQQANQLAASSKPVVAQINAVYSESEGSGRYAEYSFEVDGRYYSGRATYHGDFSDRGPINVYYLPSDPTTSAADPKANLASARGGVAFMILWNLLPWTFGAIFWSKRYRGKGE